jgi:hypothetical protein
MKQVEAGTRLEQLIALKSITKLTGGLHEAQVLQLRMWPMVVAEQVDHSETQIDIPNKKVLFKLFLNKPAPTDMDKRLAKLRENVEWLLGEEWAVQWEVSNVRKNRRRSG